jgi:molecular chaperone GrpE (heat shock protein)
LKKLAKENSEVLEYIKSESENEGNSYNIRFFLKRLLKEIDQKKNEQPTEELQDKKENKSTDSRTILGSSTESKIKVTFCDGAQCKHYEASNCNELLQKYPELKNKINCSQDNFIFRWSNNLDDMTKELEKIFERQKRELENIRKRFWEKMPKDLFPFTRPPRPFEKEKKKKTPTVKEDKLLKYLDVGFDVEELSEEELSSLGIESGIRVKNLKKGGLGEVELKLKENDIIISINDEKVYNKWTLKRLLKPYLVEHIPLKIEVLRDGKIQVINQ